MASLLLLPGDGIGPEVIAQVRRVAERLTPDIELSERPFGGVAFDLDGAPLSAETLAVARQSDAVLMGAVGGPQWASAPRDLRPEAGLLGLRKGLGVFANLRPAICFPALADASTLKREVIAGLDIMIVRELTGGVYFGKPRGIEMLTAARSAASTPRSTPPREIERVAASPSNWRGGGATRSLGREVQRDGDGAALARSGHRPARP